MNSESNERTNEDKLEEGNTVREEVKKYNINVLLAKMLSLSLRWGLVLGCLFRGLEPRPAQLVGPVPNIMDIT